MKECTCDPSHTVCKLGHSRDCDSVGLPSTHYEKGRILQSPAYRLGLFQHHSDLHTDGTKHDFDWATYSDDTMETGVCVCGLRQIDFDLLRLP